MSEETGKRDIVLATLISYRCQNTRDENGDGLPLVDVFTPSTEKTIQLGKAELFSLADEINGELTPVFRKAALCERMAFALRDLLHHGAVMTDRVTGESLPPYESNPDKAKELLSEFDREAKK